MIKSLFSYWLTLVEDTNWTLILSSIALLIFQVSVFDGFFLAFFFYSVICRWRFCDFTLRHCLRCLSSFCLSISFRNTFIEQFRVLALVHFIDILQFVYRNKTFITAVNYFDDIGELCLKAVTYKFKIISFDHNG